MNGSQENSEVRQKKKEHPVFFLYCNVNEERRGRETKDNQKKRGGWIPKGRSLQKQAISNLDIFNFTRRPASYKRITFPT